MWLTARLEAIGPLPWIVGTVVLCLSLNAWQRWKQLRRRLPMRAIPEGASFSKTDVIVTLLLLLTLGLVFGYDVWISIVSQWNAGML
jgi:hypothetical protein